MSEELADISAEPVIESPEASLETENADEALGDLSEAQVELIRKLTLKVDGEEIIEELPFDVTPEQAEYLKKELQLSRMSNKRAQEAADLRKKDAERERDLSSFMEYIQANPKEFLEKTGMNVKEFAEQVLEAEVEKMSMTAEERKILELQEQLEEKIKAEADAKAQSELEKQENLRNQYAAEYETDLMKAIETSGLDKNPEIISRMTQYMRVALEQGIDLSFSDIAPLVIESVNLQLNKLVGNMSIDQMIAAMGEDKVKQIIGTRKKVKKAPPTASSIKDTAAGKVGQKKVVKKNMTDFFKSL